MFYSGSRGSLPFLASPTEPASAGLFVARYVKSSFRYTCSAPRLPESIRPALPSGRAVPFAGGKQELEHNAVVFGHSACAGCLLRLSKVATLVAPHESAPSTRSDQPLERISLQ